MVGTERISPEPTYGSTQSMRLETTHRNLKLVHLPIHTSWLNQIEIYFSVLQRKVLTAADCGLTVGTAGRHRNLPDTYEATAKPFRWKFT